MKNTFDINARVHQLAVERKLSLYALAKICGIHPSTLTVTIRRGGQMKLDTVIRICDGLNMTVGEFFNPPNSSDMRS